MDMLLKEMQDMDKFVQKPVQGPSVINEVSRLQNPDQLWNTAAPKSDESLAEVFCSSHDSTIFLIDYFSSGNNRLILTQV